MSHVAAIQLENSILLDLYRTMQLVRKCELQLAKSSQQGRQGQPDRASRGQIEPARASQVARGSQIELSDRPGRRERPSSTSSVGVVG